MDRPACQSLSAYTTVHITFTIPLFPLWSVQSVQSLSAYTTMHITFTIPLFPLWAVQPVQSHSAGTTVHFAFTYTSTLCVAIFDVLSDWSRVMWEIQEQMCCV